MEYEDARYIHKSDYNIVKWTMFLAGIGTGAASTIFLLIAASAMFPD